jgi:hypothetical protein
MHINTEMETPTWIIMKIPQNATTFSKCSGNSTLKNTLTAYILAAQDITTHTMKPGPVLSSVYLHTNHQLARARLLPQIKDHGDSTTAVCKFRVKITALTKTQARV